MFSTVTRCKVRGSAHHEENDFVASLTYLFTLRVFILCYLYAFNLYNIHTA